MQRKLQLLSHTIGAFTQTTPSYGTLLETIVQKIAEALDCFCAISFLSDDEQLDMVTAAAKDPDVAEKILRANREEPYRAKEPGVLTKVLKDGECVLLNELPPDLWTRRFKREELAREIQPIGVYSLLAVPLRLYAGERAGFLIMSRYGEPREPFGQEDLFLVQNLAEHAALAISNAKLFEEKQRELSAKEKLSERLRLLSGLSHELAEVGDDLQLLLDTISSRMSALFGGCCLVRLLSEGSDALLEDLYGLYPTSSMNDEQRELFLHSGRVLPNSLIWRVFTSKEPLFFTEIPWERLPAWTTQVLRSLRIASLIAAPLIAKNKVLGIIVSFRTDELPSYTRDDFEFFLEASSKASLFLLNAALARAQQRELAEKKALSDRLQFLSTSAREFAAVEGELEELLKVIVQRFQASLGGGCMVWLRDESAHRPPRSYHPDPNLQTLLQRLHTLFSEPIPGGFMEKVLESKTPVFLPTIDQAYFRSLLKDRAPEAVPLLEGLDIRSVLVVPLVSNVRAVGVMMMMRHHQDPPHSEEDLQTFIELVAHATLSIINAKLFAEKQRELTAKEKLSARLHLLSGLSAEFAGVGDDLRELLNTISSRMSALFDGVCIVRLLREESDGSLREDVHSLYPESAMAGEQRAMFAQQALVAPGSLAWRLFTSKEPLFFRVLPEGLPFEAQHILRDLRVHSVIGAPLIAKGKAIGVIALLRTEDAPPYAQDDFDFFLEATSKASLFLLNAALARSRQRELEEKKALSDKLRFLSDSTREFAAVGEDLSQLVGCVARRFQSCMGGLHHPALSGWLFGGEEHLQLSPRPEPQRGAGWPLALLLITHPRRLCGARDSNEGAALHA